MNMCPMNGDVRQYYVKNCALSLIRDSSVMRIDKKLLVMGMKCSGKKSCGKTMISLFGGRGQGWHK